MTLRVYIDGKDVTEQVDLSAAADMPSGPGRFPTEAEVAWLLTGWAEYRGSLPQVSDGMRRTIVSEGRRRWYRDDPDQAAPVSLAKADPTA